MPFASSFAYFVRTALHGIVSSPLPSAIAVVTIGVSLVLVGALSLLLSNMEDLLHGLGDELHVAAYLEPGVSERQREVLQTLVTTVEGVDSVRVVSEEEALERFRAALTPS